jgi:cytochrome c oxidase assembly protein subunit 11
VTSPSPHRSLVASLIALVVGMVMLSFAAVPLYRLFCQMTGFGGTTQEALAAPGPVLDREITISFNADTDPNLPWRFKPVQLHQTIRVGEQALAAYKAENLTNQPVTGMATYNVTPFEAGPYFHKIACFCFEQQTLKPGEVVNMPVSYFIDPKIADDPYLKDVKHITLSYTFFHQDSKNQ